MPKARLGQNAHVLDGTLPDPGTVCQQEVPFEPLPAPVADTLQLQAAPASQVVSGPHVKPVLGRSLQ
jgi:hypothetical protein